LSRKQKGGKIGELRRNFTAFISDHVSSHAQRFKSDINVTGTCVYLETIVTRFMQPMPILALPSTKSFLGLNQFIPAHML